MATQIKMRRGTTSQHSSFTGSEAEVTIDTDKEVAVVHNGSTAGGFPLARADQTLALSGGTISGTLGVTGVLTTTAATVFNGGFASNAASSIGGTTPTLTIGDAGAEDAKIVFDGNAVDYHIGLDDSADSLVIGKGSALGTTTNLAIDSNGNVGVNVVPENSGGTWRNFQLGGANIAYRDNDAADVFVGTNYLFETDNGEVLRAAEAGSRMFFNNNIITFQTLATGDAGSDLSATETLKIDASGNIIIASTGGTLQTATAGTSNFRAGVNAGNSIASGGIENVCVGDEAGTAITTGDYNSAFGYKALHSDTLGNRSTAIGREALLTQNFTSDTNTYNTAVGYGAGLNNATGVQNTILGAFTGYYGTTADNSTFVGYAAGFGNDGSPLTGNNNTAVGHQAGGLLQGTAHSNVLLGHNAGDNITTGDSNIIIGSGIDAASATADNQLNIGGWIVGSAGQITMPSQPSFHVVKNADQNNIAVGSNVTVVWQVESYDVGANFASNTFTAPVAGKYIFTASIRVDSLDSTASEHNDMAIVTSNRSYKNIFDLRGLSADPTYWNFSINAVADMDAGDTAYVQFFQDGGTAQSDIKNDSGRTYFSGILVG